jgi:hypothetical protein
MSSGRRFLSGAVAAGLLLASAACDRAPVLAVSAAQAEAQPAAPSNGRIAVAASASGIRSLLDVRAPMRFGDYVWNEAGAGSGPIWIKVDLERQLISVFRGGDEIGTAVILFGADGKETPRGDFHVLQKDADYHSHTYDAPMPYMLRLTEDGVAIHASNVREGWATHGCVGVPMAFAHRLFEAARLGDRVTIS